MTATKCYVWMTDKFMSGWGKATAKTAKYVVECDNAEQADAIYRAALDRSEMKHVNSGNEVPYWNKSQTQVTVKKFADLSGPWLKYMPSKRFRVLCRKQGAIGVFSWEIFHAADKVGALDCAQNNGYECNAVEPFDAE